VRNRRQNGLARQLNLNGALPRALGGVGKPHAVRIIWRWFLEKKRLVFALGFNYVSDWRSPQFLGHCHLLVIENLIQSQSVPSRVPDSPDDQNLTIHNIGLLRDLFNPRTVRETEHLNNVVRFLDAIGDHITTMHQLKNTRMFSHT
jgi:hypothetical protein